MYSALSTFNTTTEVPLSKTPNPQLLPGRRSINDCPLLRVCVHGVCMFTAVCVHLGWDKYRARIPSMGHHTWPYVTNYPYYNNHYNHFSWKSAPMHTSTVARARLSTHFIRQRYTGLAREECLLRSVFLVVRER